MKLQLIIVFNHRYDMNIPVLKKYYETKFKKIKFLVPGYGGDRDDVIPVFRYLSFNFAGFFEEGFDGYCDDSDYYMFLADDALLNPKFDENLIVDMLLSGGKKAYITDIQPCNRKNGIGWYHAVFMNLPFRNKCDKFMKYIPEYEMALHKANNFFGHYSEEYKDDFYIDVSSREEYKKQRYRDIFESTKVNGNKIAYPLAGGWSDLVIVHKSIIKQFSRLCGIFSSMHFFCEIAIPTAIMLLCERKEVTKLSDVNSIYGLTQDVLWKDDRENLLNRYDGKLINLVKDYSEKKLLIHPIKLSQWDKTGI